MSNYEIVKQALLKEFHLSDVDKFLEFVRQDKDLNRLVERDPHKAAARLAEILRIAKGK